MGAVGSMVHHGLPNAGVFSTPALLSADFAAAEGFREGYAVPMTHNIIQYRINSRRYVVEGTSHVEQVLIDGVVVTARRAVDIEQTLEVEWCPAHEECNHHSRQHPDDGLFGLRLPRLPMHAAIHAVESSRAPGLTRVRCSGKVLKLEAVRSCLPKLLSAHWVN